MTTVRMPSKNHAARIDTCADNDDPTSIEWRRRVIEAEAVPEEYSVRALVVTTVVWLVVIVTLALCYLFRGDE